MISEPLTSLPLVSVISIFYNASAYLSEAIDSVLCQTCQNFELLLVDDGSTDEGTAIARAYEARDPARVRYLNHPGHANRGMSATRNLGLSEARGEFVAFIDADDRWVERKLEEQARILDALPEVDAVCGSVRYWQSWNGGPDKIVRTGQLRNRPVPPPQASLSLYPLGRAAAPCPYHHGDPDRYRGRPAGFWEMADHQAVMGQVVQVIGNRLDAGKVVASAETKVMPWSYRATLIEAYRHSPSIINQAIRNAVSGTYLQKLGDGRNCRLPSNTDVARLVVRAASQRVRRIFYGALKEKAWSVSTAALRGGPIAVLTGSDFPESVDWQTLSTANVYSFYADPFFAADGAILVEALRSRTGLGEVVRIQCKDHRTVMAAEGHVSYPSSSIVRGREVIVPETASWSAPRAYIADGPGLGLHTILKMRGDAHVTDPTLFEHQGRLYLFGNDRAAGSNLLNLWTAPTLDGEFVLHPASPIRVSPEGSRMGGAIIRHDGRLFRLGQDLSRGYGDGLIAFEIATLSPDAYAERVVGHIRFADRRGPHTLNFRGNQMVFDWYKDRVSLLAGFHRFAAFIRPQMRRPTATQ